MEYAVLLNIIMKFPLKIVFLKLLHLKLYMQLNTLEVMIHLKIIVQLKL
ncbi:uncharacterized protein DC041_0002471 [Schistosoma bovis]|uniref:Uncharacterized protein n=1 Tax=Schistosoma bovis TaxID=6184 RepID=A0A430PZL4_SCHBO|nr:uncharacterized protein DC041_0002471 [Schistosoma bovis]